MAIWKDMKVKGKIMVLVVGVCLGLLAVGAVGAFNLRQMNLDEAEVQQGIQHVALSQDIKNTFLAMRLDLVYMLALRDAQKISEKEQDYKSLEQVVRKKLDQLHNASGLDAKEKEEFQGFLQGFDAYVQAGNKIIEMSNRAARTRDPKAFEEVTRYAVESVAPLYAKPAGIIATFVDDNLKESQQLMLKGNSRYHRAEGGMLVFVLVIVGAALAGGSIIANSVSRPLQSVLFTLQEVSSGKLTSRSDVDSNDEMGLLARQVNRTAEELSSVVSLVAGNSEKVASAATELHATSAAMAGGAEEMAQQASSVATASEEMSATSNDIARSCHAAAEEASRATKTATEGAAVVEATVQVMGRISGQVMSTACTVESLGNRGDQIGEIVGTIQDIADQTNLLALNAAIEAARAGEQGRGFAVVADEVRALAQRTTTATKQIAEMIQAIQQETRNAVQAMEQGVKEVESGTAQAARSGDALRAILEQINAVNMQVSQIATAAEEQTATTGEISNNIQQINDVVQHTARGAKESVVAADMLSGLAEDLEQLVGQFNY